MRTSATDSVCRFDTARLAPDQVSDVSESGFSLIELLVALVVMATLLSIAVLTLPNHEARYWRDNLDQLVSSLNMAQDESALSGMPMLAHVDGEGWHFSLPASANSANGIYSGTPFLPDVYRPQRWHMPVVMAQVQLSLGAEFLVEVLQIPIQQGSRHAVLMRSSNGRFQWVGP